VLWQYDEEDDIYNLYSHSPLYFIGKGGYGSVYKIEDQNIVVKYSVYEGVSERLAWQNEYDGIEEEASEEDEKRAFCNDVRYEVETQIRVHRHIKAIDGTPVTPRVLNAYVMEKQGQQYSYIFMEYFYGISFGKVIDEDSNGYVNALLQYSTVPIYKSIKSQVETILAELHALDISHNDLLMNNIIIRFNDETPIVKIIDFGQATPLHLSIYLYAKRFRRGKRPDEVTYKNVINLLDKGIDIITKLSKNRYSFKTRKFNAKKKSISRKSRLRRK
jgi:serine/threonine protein kinase